MIFVNTQEDSPLLGRTFRQQQGRRITALKKQWSGKEAEIKLDSIILLLKRLVRLLHNLVTNTISSDIGKFAARPQLTSAVSLQLGE